MRVKLTKKKILLLIVVGVVGLAVASYVVLWRNDKNMTTNQNEESSDTAQYKPFASEETDTILTEATRITFEQGDPASAMLKIKDYLDSGRGTDKEKAFMNAKAANYFFVYGRDQAKATELYNKAIELQPNDPTWYADLGKMYFRANDKGTAAKYFQQAVEIYDTKLPNDYTGEDREYYVKLLEGRDPYLNMLTGGQ